MVVVYYAMMMLLSRIGMENPARDSHVITYLNARADIRYLSMPTDTLMYFTYEESFDAINVDSTR